MDIQTLDPLLPEDEEWAWRAIFAVELQRRFDHDLAQHVDYCIGEARVQALLDRFSRNEPIPRRP